MTSRMQQAISRLKTRLHDSTGIIANITDGNLTVLALQITVVKVDLIRAIRAESEFQLEDDDAAFLVSSSDLPCLPEVGWMIHTGDVEYRVTERPELQSCWRWHDRQEVQRVIFVKEWSRT